MLIINFKKASNIESLKTDTMLQQLNKIKMYAQHKNSGSFLSFLCLDRRNTGISIK